VTGSCERFGYSRGITPGLCSFIVARAAVCYVSLNPVRAGLVARAEDWPWSSVRAHLAGVDDALVKVRPVLDRIPSFTELLKGNYDEAFTKLRRSEGTGRPGTLGGT
jgi:putative transposase